MTFDSLRYIRQLMRLEINSAVELLPQVRSP